MKRLEDIVAELSDAELKEAYDEIVEWQKVGELKMDGVVRKTRQAFKDSSDVEHPFHMMDAPFLFEIAKRHYENPQIENRLSVINQEIKELSSNDYLDHHDLNRLEDLEAEYNKLSEKLDGAMVSSVEDRIQ